VTARTVPVAAVVVTWNSSRWIADCLDSLRGLARPPAEVVVVDSGSTDGTAGLVRDGYPEAVVVECGTNVGFCRANNLGIARTSSPFVLVLNPDTRLDPGFLDELLPAIEDPRVGIVAGKLLRLDGRTLDSAGQLLGRSRQPIDRGYGREDRGRFEVDEEVFGACGAAALYRRTMLASISDADGQVFDESFFAFYEDLDLAWRARRARWKAVYRHRAVGYHARGGTSGDSGAPGRWQALRRRSPDVRFHVAKNRYLTILRNDTVGGYLRNLPFILARDAATVGVLLLSSPGVLGRLWRERGRFREALRRRRLDAARHVHHVQDGGGP
jgi:GT2 family glycosyltransferase